MAEIDAQAITAYTKTNRGDMKFTSSTDSITGENRVVHFKHPRECDLGSRQTAREPACWGYP